MTARPGIPGLRRTGLALLITALTVAGCASTGSQSVAAPPAAATAPLATSMSAPAGETWAIVAMGGSAAQENLFWELLTRPAGSSKWELDTPPGVADNGGLVAAASGGALTVAFRPSQDLTFSPLASTSDDGKSWSTGLIDASVAAVPDALAASDGNMLALLGNGTIDQAAADGAGWTRLAAPGAIAASASGGRCQVTALTAVAYTASGTPLAAASCARPGTIGIFARTAGTWQAAGPVAPAGTSGNRVRVIGLTGTSSGDAALLASGTGKTTSLFAAWTSGGTRWDTSPLLPAGPGQVLADGTGPGGSVWVLQPGGRAATVAGPGASWRQLTVPRGTAALATGPGGTTDALAVAGATLSVYQLTPAGAWRSAQVIQVPLQYGSSS
jgi:hypothetical protein